MDFLRYAERAARLVNAGLDDADALRAHLADREWLVPQVVDRDAGALRRFTRELRPVFEASHHGQEQEVVDRLNALLGKHPVVPSISGHGPSPTRWHMHVADRRSSVSDLLVAESLMGLATLVCDLGATRLGVCEASGCDDAFVDTSPNRSRRYCSERCSSRANVAAFRARQRAAGAAGPSSPSRAADTAGAARTVRA